ncbi:hypothetical protein ACFQ0Q_08115 [Streptomyces aureus]
MAAQLRSDITTTVSRCGHPDMAASASPYALLVHPSPLHLGTVPNRSAETSDMI